MARLENLPRYMHSSCNVYYGYVILVVGTIGVIASIPGQTMGISVYTPFLMEALQVSRSELSLAYLAGTVSSSLFLPAAGRILDRLGPRAMGAFASISLAAFLVYMSNVDNLTDGLRRVLRVQTSDVGGVPTSAAPSLLVAFVGFFGVRHFGQGQLTMVSRTMMAKFFERNRGKIMGLSGVFQAFAFAIAPLWLNWLITSYGWESSLCVMSGMLVGVASMITVFFRSSPEDCGLAVDGGIGTAAEIILEREASARDSFSAEDALGTPTFWIYTVGILSNALINTAITFHMSFIADLHHMSNTRAYSIFLPVAVVSTSSDLLAGFLSDSVDGRYLLGALNLSLLACLVALKRFSSPVGFGVVAATLGISSGLTAQLQGSAWAKLFGREHLGAIAGYTTSFMVFGSALGPFAFTLGGATHSLGAFNRTLLCVAALPLSALLLAPLAARPVKPQAAQYLAVALDDQSDGQGGDDVARTAEPIGDPAKELEMSLESEL